MKLKEIKELIKLANDLDVKGFYSEADAIDEVILKVSQSNERDRRLMKAYEERRLLEDLGGSNPYYDEEFDFDWILQGIIFRIVSENNEGWFDNFINNNGAKIREITGGQKPKYLGSGATGDAWLIGSGRDKKVLKLFDANSRVGGRNPVDENKELMRMLHTQPTEASGRGGSSGLASIPMIYESGVFDYGGDPTGPGDPYFIGRFGTAFNTSGAFRPAYAVMEFTETMSSLTSKHKSMSRKELQDIKSVFKDVGIEEESAAKWAADFEARGWTLDNIINFANEDFLINTIGMDPTSASYVMNYVNSKMTGHKVAVLIHNLEYNIRMTMANASPDDIRAKGDKHYLDMIRWALKPYEPEVNEMIKAYGLPSNWLEDFIRSILENIKLGRRDLHAGNWGFRDGKVVFFDA